MGVYLDLQISTRASWSYHLVKKMRLAEDSRKDSEELPAGKASLLQQQAVNTEGEKTFIFRAKLQMETLFLTLQAGNGSRAILVD